MPIAPTPSVVIFPAAALALPRVTDADPALPPPPPKPPTPTLTGELFFAKTPVTFMPPVPPPPPMLCAKMPRE